MWFMTLLYIYQVLLSNTYLFTSHNKHYVYFTPVKQLIP
jgi:hypothetical protein